MTDEAKRQQVREFLSALSPSEFRRVVELFRDQMGLPPLELAVAPVLTDGRELPLPGMAMAAESGR